jgi:hypothetical protein
VDQNLFGYMFSGNLQRKKVKPSPYSTNSMKVPIQQQAAGGKQAIRIL